MEMSNFYVWIFVTVMCVITVHAATVKRTVSNPTSSPESKWVYIPVHANVNDTWIPIPYTVLQSSNATDLSDHFKLIRMYSNGVLSNDTLYPSQDKQSPNVSTGFIIYLCILLTALVMSVIVIAVQAYAKW